MLHDNTVGMLLIAARDRVRSELAVAIGSVDMKVTIGPPIGRLGGWRRNYSSSSTDATILAIS